MTAPTAVQVVVPLPPRKTHPNARAHFRAVAKARKAQRIAARLAAIDTMARAGMTPPSWTRAVIRSRFETWTGRPQDPDNLVAWLKATVDGLVDAGLLHDDGGLTWMTPTITKARSETRVLITVEGLP